MEHGRKHSVQPQRGHGGCLRFALCLREFGYLIQRKQRGGDLCPAHLQQFPADELPRRFQRKDIGSARRIGREHNISQRFPTQLQPHQAAQIILVTRQCRPGKGAAGQLHTAQRACRVAALRLQAEQLPLCSGPAALKMMVALRHIGTVQRRAGQILFPVAQKAGVAGNAASLGRAGQIFYMPHQKALFIGAGGHKAPHCPGSRINRTRHCSPARPADRP